MATREVGRKYVFTYKDVKTDDNGWAAPKSYRPIPFDLVLLKVTRLGSEHPKAIPGWWTGSEWQGQRLLADDQVICWKHKDRSDE